MNPSHTALNTLVILGLLTGALWGGDAAAPSPASKDAGDSYFLISHAGAGDPFWGDVFKGAQLAAQESGINLRILAPDRPADLQGQLELLDLAIASGTKAIATTIPDCHRFSVHLRRAQQMGIPVIAYNARSAGCDRASIPYLTYVGMNNLKAGRVAARRIMASGRVKQRLLIINHAPQLSGLLDRQRGILEAYADSPVKVDVLNPTYVPEAIATAFLDYLAAHPDLDGVITLGTISLRVIAPLIEQQRPGLYCSTFDRDNYTLRYIERGVVDFGIDQQPLLQGYLAVTLMVLHAKYAMTASDIATDVPVMDTASGFRVQQAQQGQAPIHFISHAGAGDSFWLREIMGATQAAREAGAPLKYLAPEVPNDLARQYNILMETLRSEPAVLGMTVSSDTLFSTALKNMRRKGILAVAVNTRPIDDNRERNPYQAFIGMDDYRAGRTAGERVLLKGRVRSHLLVVNHSFGHSGLAARVKGLREVLEPKGIKITDLDVTIDPAASTGAVRQFLADHRDVDGVASIGTASIASVGRVLKDLDKAHYWFAFDLDLAAVQFIESGMLDFSIDQQPYMQGYLLIKMLNLARRHQQIPPDIDTGVGIIDAGNVERVKKLVSDYIR